MESKRPGFDAASSSSYTLGDPEMENKRPQHEGASSSKCDESESPQQEIERISDAFYTFYEPSPPSSANLDIFFFHGLECEGAYAGDAHLLTWRSTGGKEEIWPQAWLSKDFPQARIISVRYDSCMEQTDTEGRMDLYLIGENIVQEIEWARQSGYDRPVIFVGHGFGGIVMKKLCVYAQNKKEKSVGGHKMSLLLESIRGFFFYATPHLGMQGMEPPKENEGPLVRWMRTLNSESVRLHEAFSELWGTRRYRWTIYGLGETESKFGRQGLQVPEASARFGDKYITVSGDHFSVCKPFDKNSNNYKHLQYFIGEVQRQVQLGKEALLMVPKITVGVDALLTQILGKHIWDHQFVGFCGMGGVGKTTLSKLVFNEVYAKFEYCCFVEEIKHIPGTKDEIKKKIWEKMRHHGVLVGSVSGLSGGDGWSQVNERSLLVVFDDVENTDHVELLKEIAHHNRMKESRFMLTSRDITIVRECELQYNIHICTLDSLQDEDANKLLITYAFPGEQEPPEAFKSMIKQVVEGCDGLPLTLEVLGNYLKGKNIELWEEIPVALRVCDKVASLEEKVWSKLQLSYDRLPGEEVKQMFLDIAAFFMSAVYGFSGDDAIMAWNSLFGNAHNRLQILEDRALVRIRHEKWRRVDQKRFYMHEHLKRMGQRIARLEGRRYDLLRGCSFYGREDQELGKIVGLSIYTESPLVREGACTFCLMQEFWPKLTSIRYMILRGSTWRCCRRCRKRECPLPSTVVLLRLKLHDKVNLVISAGARGNYPDDRKGAQSWSRWCRESLFRLNLRRIGTLSLTKCAALVKLDLVYCRNVDLGGMNELQSMRVLEISQCGAVRNWPTSLRDLRHLERLELEGIREPFELPTTFGDLTQLQHLLIRGCKVLSVPSSLQSLTSLRHLEISEVIGQQSLPNIIGSLRQLRVLSLECWGIVGLVDALRELTALRKLTLDCKGILELSDTLGNLTSLEKLKLSFPQSTRFGRLPEAIGQLSNLQSLSLKNVKKPATLPEALGNLRSLQKLEISDCEVESLPESLGRLSSLTYLEVSGCGDLKTLPESLGRLSNLTSLEVSGCGDLKTLPETIGDLASLTELVVSSSAIHSLPESLGRLSNLTDLEVRGCGDLKTLPETIGDLASLTELVVSSSAIHSLPESLGRLSNLTDLEVRGCGDLKTLPETIGDLASLTELVVSSSAIHSLPESLGRLSNLTDLEVRGCGDLKTLPETIGDLASLTELVVSSSAIHSLPESLGRLSNLTDLEVRGCGDLKTLPETIGDLASLRHLDFSDSALHSLPESLGRLSGLTHLGLCSCKNLKTLPETIGNLSNLRFLGIRFSAAQSLPNTLKGLSELRIGIKGCKNLKRSDTLEIFKLEGSGLVAK